MAPRAVAVAQTRTASRVHPPVWRAAALAQAPGGMATPAPTCCELLEWVVAGLFPSAGGAMGWCNVSVPPAKPAHRHVSEQGRVRLFAPHLPPPHASMCLGPGRRPCRLTQAIARRRRKTGINVPVGDGWSEACRPGVLPLRPLSRPGRSRLQSRRQGHAMHRKRCTDRCLQARTFAGCESGGSSPRVYACKGLQPPRAHSAGLCSGRAGQLRRAVCRRNMAEAKPRGTQCGPAGSARAAR